MPQSILIASYTTCFLFEPEKVPLLRNRRNDDLHATYLRLLQNMPDQALVEALYIGVVHPGPAATHTIPPRGSPIGERSDRPITVHALLVPSYVRPTDCLVLISIIITCTFGAEWLLWRHLLVSMNEGGLTMRYANHGTYVSDTKHHYQILRNHAAWGAMHMHAAMWLIGCRPKALYFSHAQGRAPSKEIEDQKYGHTISLSFPRDAHAQNTESHHDSGKDRRHARGTAHLQCSPVKVEKRNERVGKMCGICLRILIVFPRQLVHHPLYFCVLYIHNLQVSTCAHVYTR